jgi:hypothetical protein
VAVSALQPLLDKAFHVARARDANAEIAGLRETHAAGGREALSYEVVLNEADGVDGAAQKLLPKLVYFLDCRGLPLHDARGVFISGFVGESLYFLHATDFVAVLAEAFGATLPELKEKYGAAST